MAGLKVVYNTTENANKVLRERKLNDKVLLKKLELLVAHADGTRTIKQLMEVTGLGRTSIRGVYKLGHYSYILDTLQDIKIKDGR